MPMLDCPETLELLAAFAANELDALSSLGVEKHLGGCADCREQWRWEQEVSGSLQRMTAIVPAPSAALLARVSKPPRVAGEERAGAEVGFSLFAGRFRVRVALVAAAAAALLLLLAAVGGGFLTRRAEWRKSPGVSSAAAPTPALLAFVANHVRSLSESPSSEQFNGENPAAAAAWLEARLPHAARGPRQVPADFRLVGARICRAGREPAGVLIYEHAGQRVSCFISPPNAPAVTSPDEPGGRLVALADGRQVVCGRCRGSSFAAWEERGFFYTLVADLPEAALIAFAGDRA